MTYTFEFPKDPAILGALRCLDLQDVKDTYMLTLMAYAYSLYDIKSTRRLEIMSMLRSKVKRKGSNNLLSIHVVYNKVVFTIVH